MSTVPDGYLSGPAAATEATGLALTRVGVAPVVVLVEGVSDQIAVDTLLGPAAVGTVAVVPAGGVGGFARLVARFIGEGREVRVLCDAGEETSVRRRVGDAASLHVCHADLEDELIRAVTPAVVLAIIEAAGDADAFRSLQRQPQWRDAPVDAQLRRFFGSGATRKIRYAAPLVSAAVRSECVPSPLLEIVRTSSR